MNNAQNKHFMFFDRETIDHEKIAIAPPLTNFYLALLQPMDEHTQHAIKFWDRAAAKFDREGDSNTFRLIVEKTMGYLKPSHNVLDFGCATGRVAERISAAVSHIDAIDFSADMIAIARANHPKQNINYIHITIFDEQLKPGSYDAILCFYILHLLPDPLKEIKRIHELLKPGGIFLSATTCIRGRTFLSGLISVLARFGWVPRVKSFRVNELEEWLTSKGFNIIDKILLPGTYNQYFIVAASSGC